MYINRQIKKGNDIPRGNRERGDLGLKVVFVG